MTVRSGTVIRSAKDKGARMTTTEVLARHASEISSDDLPEAGRAEMRRLLLDYCGVAVSGSQTESGRIVGDFVSELGGVAQATVIGNGTRVPSVHAAFANAVSEHSIELDDVDDLALFHYGPPVVSAALAVAEQTGATGADLITAMLLGCETTNRVSLATNPELRNRGFHTTPTCGVFGAAVAAGRLLGLDAGQMTSALGLAGAQASGLMEMYGPSMQKRINPGPAARNGVTAAALALMGYTGAETILEGEHGFGIAFAGALDEEKLLAGLGSVVPVPVEYKAYSAARPIHNAIDCALELRGIAGITPDAITRVVMRRHPDWASYHQNARPRTYHEAQVSLPYAFAVAFVDGAALPPQFADDQLGRPELLRLAGLVEFEVAPELNRGVSCQAVVTLQDGTTHSVTVDDAKGSIGNPQSNDELAAKATMLAEPVIGVEQTKRLIAAVQTIEDANDVHGLIALTVPGAR
jgi:2-methylcitrate dehydratase PrpD